MYKDMKQNMYNSYQGGFYILKANIEKYYGMYVWRMQFFSTLFKYPV